jgi:hypothetical protein
MARLQRRTLTTFLETLPREVDRLAIHTGEQRAPAHRGDLPLADYRDDDGKVMVARVEDILAQRIEGYGYPEQHASFQLLAYQGSKKLDSFQDTAGSPGGAVVVGPALEAVVVRMADTIRLALADSNATIKEGMGAIATLTNQNAELRAESTELQAALMLKDEAIRAAEEGATLALQLRTVDALESGMTAWANGKGGGVSPGAIIALCKKAPDKAKALVKALMKDEAVRALFMDAVSEAAAP